MLVDRSLRFALRNYSTLFLLALVVTGPVAAIYTVVRRSELMTDDVPGSLWVAVAVAVAALALLRRPTRRVLARDLAGDVPTVADALRRSRSEPQPDRASGGAAVAIAACAALGLFIGAIALGVALAAGGVVPAPARLGWIAVSVAVSVAAGAPFPLAVGAFYVPRAKGPPGEQPTTSVGNGPV